MPKVSVLLPVFNSERYLQKTIHSILTQTFSDFELLIIDDASEDCSLTIIKNFKDQRIQHFRNTSNQGIANTRNKLMELAKGEYLAIADHDDIFLPHRLEKQVQFLDNHPDVSVVGSWFEIFCSETEGTIFQRVFSRFKNLGWVWKQPEFPTIHDAMKGCPVMHPSAMIRRSDMKKYKLQYKYEYTPAEDYKLWTDMLMLNLNMVNMPEVLLKYNLHGKNFSIQKKAQMRISDKKVKADIKSYLHYKNRFNYPYFFVIFQKLRLKSFLKG